MIFCTALDTFHHSTSEAICLIICSQCSPQCTETVTGIKSVLEGNQVGYISLVRDTSECPLL